MGTIGINKDEMFILSSIHTVYAQDGMLMSL